MQRTKFSFSEHLNPLFSRPLSHHSLLLEVLPLISLANNLFVIQDSILTFPYSTSFSDAQGCHGSLHVNHNGKFCIELFFSLAIFSVFIYLF